MFIDNVLAFEYVNWDGELIRCTRSENAADFYRVLGGTGQYGIIATMTLQSLGITPTVHLSPRSEVAAIPEPVLVSRPVAGEPGPASEAKTDLSAATAVPESLFDHSADVEFILDPVVLRKGRAHTKLPLGPNVQGEKAVITF